MELIFGIKAMRAIFHAADGRPSGSSLQVVEEANDTNFQAVEQKGDKT
jgi:hypothetical protein